ncbi:MAG: alanine--tRNA ligase, partial [Syntrophales bacterium]|nr:alanine--tRNA ligase [Syntrophales bacterium]
MNADTLREKFLEFFKSKGHEIARSDSLVPKDDPTVLFTSAGMNQFKKNFLGIDKRLKRAVSAQRCLRTGDLDKVGKTAGHHTFFEMLGNFSFGDYFKKEAISWAWEFLTRELNIPDDKLWVSVYKDDTEAYEAWSKDIKLPKPRMIKLGDKENFWPSEAKQKGPNGPCGPCSEIFYDRGKGVGCGEAACGPSCDCGRFVEIWNLVFTQFNRKEGGTLEPLPQKNIDTGMGLERLTAVMQGKDNNFETELFQPIINAIIAKIGGRPKKEPLYAIADHIRAVVFAIADGVIPSNEERGYVVRKLIRKAVYDLQKLGTNDKFLYQLVYPVVETMKIAYPELGKRHENIAQIILAEEEKYLQILGSVAGICSDKFSGIDKTDGKKIGRVSFDLYDTHGIPIELTEEWLKGHGYSFSKDEFERNLSRQRQQSRGKSAMKGDVFSVGGFKIDAAATIFKGYDSFESEAKILKIFKGADEMKSASEGDEVAVVLDKTPFYPESGGQVADRGSILKKGCLFEVKDTQRTGSVIVHYGVVAKGAFKEKDKVSANVDKQRRLAIARNHTATHMLQSALRQVLGEHIQQQGSLVAEDRLRFDFTHFKAVSPEEISRIEEIVNKMILDNEALTARQMPLSEAKKTGALAFFGEKYSDKVRVVAIGGFSRELCGGTHLGSTGQIGLFKIISESSIAQGVRRIEAQTGAAAYNNIQQSGAVLRELSGILRVPAA